MTDHEVRRIVSAACRKVVERAEIRERAGYDGQAIWHDAGTKYDPVVIAGSYPIDGVRHFNDSDESAVAGTDLVSVATQSAI